MKAIYKDKIYAVYEVLHDEIILIDYEVGDNITVDLSSKELIIDPTDEEIENNVDM